MKDLLDIQIIPQTMSETCISPEDFPIAYAYVPYQKFENLYSKEKALRVGTVFPSLDKPLGVYGKEFNGRSGGNSLC